MSRYTDASLLVVPSLNKAGKLYAVKSTTGLGDLTVTRASTKNVLGSNGLYVSVPANTPALEYNTDRSFRGLLVEPGATNQIRNNSMVGAVVGSPGTLPNTWNELALGGLSREVVSIGTENGIDYIDLRYFGTASSSASTLRVNGTQITATTAGATWSTSSFFKIVSEPSPYNSFSFGAIELLGGTFNTTDYATISPTSVFQRFEHNVVIGGSNDGVRPQCVFNLTSGQSYDFTIRIGWPQMETGSVATSPIVTTASTASRSSDIITLTSASSLIGQSAGFAVIELDMRNAGINRILMSFNDGTNNNRIALQVGSSNTVDLRIVAGGALQGQTTGQAVTTGVQKWGFVYSASGVILSKNGSTVATLGAITIPSTTIFDLHNAINGSQFNGWGRFVAIGTSTISEAALNSLTAL